MPIIVSMTHAKEGGQICAIVSLRRNSYHNSMSKMFKSNKKPHKACTEPHTNIPIRGYSSISTRAMLNYILW